MGLISTLGSWPPNDTVHRPPTPCYPTRRSATSSIIAGPETDHLSAVRPDALAEREFANRKAGLLTRLVLFEKLGRRRRGSSGGGQSRTGQDAMVLGESIADRRLEEESTCV